MITVYHLTEIPAGVEQMTDANRLLPVLKWSGRLPIPTIGQRVTVRMNHLGEGTVREYFHEAGYLGVAVALDNPPEWYTKQNHGNPLALVFGRELQ